MSLVVETFVLGSIDNNTYLLWDDATGQAVVIDPSFEPADVLMRITAKNLAVTGIWLTHGHFDHFFGIPEILSKIPPAVPVYIHQNDSDLYLSGGLAPQFGIKPSVLPSPAYFLTDGEILFLGASRIQVRHTPGHSPGHVVFYAEEIGTVFAGDLIFKQSVGRTDLPGADQDKLLKSIYSQILTLPPETILRPGHGEQTTVEDEIEFNPYLN